MAQKISGWTDLISEGGLTASGTTKKHNLGELVKDDEGNIYRYVQNIAADSVAIADGTCVYLRDADDWIVTPDISNGLTALVEGVGIGAIAAGSYGWILVSGFHDAVKTDNGVAAKDPLVGHSTDGEADTMAAGEEGIVFGIATSADTATEPHTCSAVIKCL